MRPRTRDPVSLFVIHNGSIQRITSGVVIARTGNAFSPLELSEITEGDLTGLLCVAPTLQLSDTDSAWAIGKLDSELLDEMSFRFTIDDGRWSEDFMTFTIRSVNIHRGDVSIVGYGANPHTAGAVRAFKAVVHDRLSPKDAMKSAGLN